MGKGGAYGFTLGSLSALKDTKTTDNSQKLLDIIVRLVKDTDEHKDCESWLDDTRDLPAMARMDVMAVAKELNQLMAKLRQIGNKLKKYDPSKFPRGDRFQEVMQP